MVAVLDPDAQTGFVEGYFAWSNEDDSAYLIGDDGALPVSGTRGLTTLDDAQLARMGSDWFSYEVGLVFIDKPGSPVVVGNNGFEGQIFGVFAGVSRKVFLLGGAGLAEAYSPIGSAVLNFDFLIAETLDPRISASGGVGGTRFNASGVLAAASAPRFNYKYNPASGLWEGAGLLSEDQKENLLIYSEEIENAAWSASNVSITANAVTAPDAAMSADIIVEDTSTSSHSVTSATISISKDALQTFSCFVKAAGRDELRLQVNAFSGNLIYADFDLSDGTVTRAINTGSGSDVSATISQIADGFFRVAVSGIPNAASSATGVQASLVLKKDDASSYTGDGSSGICVWGAQLEEGASASSYIPTTGSTATRTADSLTMTGADFSDWFNPEEGTFVVEFDAVSMEVIQAILQVSDGSWANQVSLFLTPENKVKLHSKDNDIITVDVEVSGVLSGGPHRVAIAYKVNDFASSVDGGSVTGDASAVVPAVDRLHLAQWHSGDGNLNGHIRSIRYYSRRLPDAELQALST